MFVLRVSERGTLQGRSHAASPFFEEGCSVPELSGSLRRLPGSSADDTANRLQRFHSALSALQNSSARLNAKITRTLRSRTFD